MTRKKLQFVYEKEMYYEGDEMKELWYKLTQIPDLTLNKYSAVEGGGTDGVLEKHDAFLRQLNRKGIVSDVSFHLFYLYLKPEDVSKDKPGRRLQIYLLARGEGKGMDSVPALVKASPLANFFVFEETASECAMREMFEESGLEIPTFDTCAFLTKTETFLFAGGDEEEYYLLRDWEMNEDGRLYNMCNMMEKLEQTALYRVDLYPVERSNSLRDALRRPMNILRKRQEDRDGRRNDYYGRDVISNYEKMIENFETSPHFIANIMVMANSKETAVSILDAAGAESLSKGKYSISTYRAKFNPFSFIDGQQVEDMDDMRERMVLRQSKPGLIICKEVSLEYNIRYLPTLFMLEEVSPFFRLPVLYDGETIQIPKETAPEMEDSNNALHLGKDKNGYDVNIPLGLLPKHAFISGVPGSGKTNAMHHITSSLLKKGIPFLVLEPAKQEYRALLNDQAMRKVFLFSPNADMSFPLHINPFEMPKGTMIAEHIRRMCAVFEGAFPLDPPLPFLLDNAIEAVYRDCGWIPEEKYTGINAEGETRGLPTMSMLYKRLEEELKTTEYSSEIRGNLESALKVRIGSLLRREMGEVFDVPRSTFEPERWLKEAAIVELESMGTGPANFLTLMLCSLIRETLKVNPQFDGDIRHVIFIEEAHNLIGPDSEEQSGMEANPKQAATAFVVKMLAEVRALKEGIVIADQLPTVMAQEVLKNTGIKVGLRITSADDRSLLGSTMAASPLQLEKMATFAPGEALIFYEKLKRPFDMNITRWLSDMEDQKVAEKMRNSRNDETLREFLKTNYAYQQTNEASFDILLEKYKELFRKVKEVIEVDVDWYMNIKCLFETKDEIKEKLKKIEIECGGKDTKSKLKKQEAYDLILSELESEISKEKSIEQVNDILIKLFDCFVALQRRKERWERVGFSDIKKCQVLILQKYIYVEYKKIYDVLALLNEHANNKGLGTVCKNKVINNNTKMVLLFKELEQEEKMFKEKFGEDFYNNLREEKENGI